MPTLRRHSGRDRDGCLERSKPDGSGFVIERVAVDVLIVGGGASGVMAAYHAHQAGVRVMLLAGSGGASARISSMMTALGQHQTDTPQALFDDMFRAGGYINHTQLLAALTRTIGSETASLARDGVPFHRSGSELARRQTTGSTWPSSVYSLGMIGLDLCRNRMSAMQRSARPPIIVRGAVLTDIFTLDGRMEGALVHDKRDGRWISVAAPAVVLATGGAGQIFGTTTNPRGSMGTGYAVALEAGCELVDMEFISFEPFVTIGTPGTKRHDLPTTVLKQGATLRNGQGKEFLDTQNAPTKDVICRAMVTEVAEGRGTVNGGVYYDLSGMNPDVVAQYVPITQALRSGGEAADRGMLEVMPAQHYLMGGVRIDERCATSVPGLFAAGEVSGGAHGAHRLAGAGGMEAVASGTIAGTSAAEYAGARRVATPQRIPDTTAADVSELTPPQAQQMRLIADALNAGCGIFRDEQALGQSVDTIAGILDSGRSETRPDVVTRSARVALSIAESARRRRESRGDHFRTDHPRRDDSRWLTNQTVALDEAGGLVFRSGAGFTERASSETKNSE